MAAKKGCHFSHNWHSFHRSGITFFRDSRGLFGICWSHMLKSFSDEIANLELANLAHCPGQSTLVQPEYYAWVTLVWIPNFEDALKFFNFSRYQTVDSVYRYYLEVQLTQRQLYNEAPLDSFQILTAGHIICMFKVLTCLYRERRDITNCSFCAAKRLCVCGCPSVRPSCICVAVT